MSMSAKKEEILELLDAHYAAYEEAKRFADKYRHPHPTDTRGWSQIIVSALTDILGYARKKGPDLEDGSDVKGANCWDAIDTPRFNGCIKAGTEASTANSIESLNDMPNLYFAMWDTAPSSGNKRFRVWVVNPKTDYEFRNMASIWYEKRNSGLITSNNFQLHPPRNSDGNVFKNTCGNLSYPLLLCAVRSSAGYQIESYTPENLINGSCIKA